jgi:hypothetical protein
LAGGRGFADATGEGGLTTLGGAATMGLALGGATTMGLALAVFF